MADIMMHASKYVPVNAQEATDKVTGKKIAGDKLHTLLFGGDQLTRKRAEVAIELKQSGVDPLDQVKGLQPVCEDWHAKKSLMEVSIKYPTYCDIKIVGNMD